MNPPENEDYEFFRWDEDEDLKCRVYDEQGREIPLRIKQEVVIIQPVKEHSPDESPNR